MTYLMDLLSLVAVSLPLLAWWRYKDLPLDRDYAPYAYPGIFKTPYLQQGHSDIKPPLIHWSYKCWLTITSSLSNSLGPRAILRLLPALGLTLAVLSATTFGAEKALALGLMFALPSLWVHMANTEWLTVALWGAALIAGNNPVGWFLLGLTPLANQKNLLLVAPVAWAAGFSLALTDLIALALGPMLALLWLTLTGRLALAYRWCLVIPKSFGKARTFRVNTLSALHLLKPGLAILLLVLATTDASSPWLLVSLFVALVAVWSKQVVPHHFIALAFPLALASLPGPTFFLALLAFCAARDLVALKRPDLVYPLTFGYRDGRHYGNVLEDGREVLDYLDEHCKKDEVIWVNGWENQIYLEAHKKAVQINVPESLEVPKELPRIIVHCTNGAVQVDYEGYETEFMTVGGFYIVLRRGDK